MNHTTVHKYSTVHSVSIPYPGLWVASILLEFETGFCLTTEAFALTFSYQGEGNLTLRSFEFLVISKALSLIIQLNASLQKATSALKG
jgi:hypothetical protein